MKRLLSVFAKHNKLYILEVADGNLDVNILSYDSMIIPNHNMPCSYDMILPTDQVELDMYELSTGMGMYIFRKSDISNGGRLSYIRKSEQNVDVFLLDNLYIVHVQEYIPSTKEDKVINEVINTYDFANKSYEEFLTDLDTKFKESGIDVLKEMEKELDFSTVPECENKNEEPEYTNDE